MKDATERILINYEEKISTLGFLLRGFLLENLKNITELPDESGNVIGFGYGTGYKDLICTIIPSKKGIKLGFFKGAELYDPAKLLTGSGKVHKYVEINSAASISDPALKALLAEAIRSQEARKL
ncbi:MAG: DUF1801 domain-containing protein [Chitinophagaceae bacterium]|nr:DUF1801 domain-containing protein [Chitinophagaceae bacterium]